MQPSSLGDRQRSRSNKPLRTILAIGFSGSTILHLGLIAGISHWWQPRVDRDEPLEITLVEPVEVDPIVPSPPAIEPKPSPDPIPKPVVLKPISKPISKPIQISTSVKPAPKAISIPVKPAPKSLAQPLETSIAIKSRSTKSTPISPKTPLKATPTTAKSEPKPISIPIPSQSFNPPFLVETPQQIATKPTPIVAKPYTPAPLFTPSIPVQKPQTIASKPSPSVNPPVPAIKTRSTIESPPVPIVTKPSIEPKLPTQTVSSSIPDRQSSPVATKPTPQPSNFTPSTPATKPQPTSSIAQTDRQPAPIKNLPAGGNNNHNPNLARSSRDRTIRGILPNNEGQLNRPNSAGFDPLGERLVPGGSPTPSTGSDRNAGKVGGNLGGNMPNGNATNPEPHHPASGSSAGLQCVQNCQIAKLQDLQDSDGGKDRLRIRIVVDPNGVVTTAEIAKSSGDRQIDAVILSGIKQMQFKPPGKTITGTIKANILL
jgi:TonB family protein